MSPAQPLTPARETVWRTNIAVEVSATGPNEAPDWRDISDRVIVPMGQSTESYLGRATELLASEAGTASITLNNRDHALTPGNASSPFYPWFGQTTRIRAREIVGWRAFVLFDAFVEVPNTTETTHIVGDLDSDITVVITAADQLARADNSRPFVSTLAAHIMGAPSATALLGYYAMGDGPEAGVINPTFVAPGYTFPPLRKSINNFNLTGAQMTFAGGTPMPGDDIAGPSSTYLETLAGDLSSISLTNIVGDPVATVAGTGPLISPAIIVTPANVVTVVMWLNAQRNNGLFQGPLAFWMYGNASPGEIKLYYDPTAGNWQLDIDANGFAWGSFAIDAPGTQREIDRPTLVALRVHPSASVELWLNETTSTIAVPGAPPASFDLDRFIGVQERVNGTGSHLQVYQSADGVGYTYEQHLAQLDVGLFGFERQRTGERIATIADLTGYPAYERDIDPGVTLMSRASLAGKTRGQAWREAADTERGRLFVEGGRLTFHDRRRVYDV